jgi:hypothetical protein
VPYVFEDGCARQQLVAPLRHVLGQLELARPRIDRRSRRFAVRSMSMMTS